MATQTETQLNDATIRVPAQVSAPATPRTVNTELSYFSGENDDGPVVVEILKDTSMRKRNWQPATIHDVRGSSVTPTLDTTGFQYVKHQSSLTDFTDEEIIKDTYYSEITDLLLKITGASKVHILHHAVRNVPCHPLYVKEEEEKGAKDVNLVEALKGPIRGVHIDQSYKGARMLLDMKYPDTAEELSKSRYQIINIWRPIKTIYRDPLAVCDARTVLEKELVPIQIIRPEYQNESFSVTAPEGREDGGHKWYYMSKQTPEDVLLFKIFDSKVDGGARFAPHTSFEDREYNSMDPRASIESRAFVFYDRDSEQTFLPIL